MTESPKRRSRNVRRRAKSRQRGMSMIELMIAMTVLAVGMLGGVVMILAGVQSNTRNKTDTTAVVLDQEVLEMFATLKNYPTTGNVAINDCGLIGANIHNASVVEGTQAAGGAGAVLYTAANAPLPSQVGDINWTVAAPTFATPLVTGYAMKYQTCNGDTYEVRWNIMQVDANPAGGDSRISLLTVSSRQTAAANAHASILFSNPKTLRTLIESN